VTAPFTIRGARGGDEADIVSCLREFAAFEKLSHTFRLTEAIVARDFMGEHRKVQCDVAEWEGTLAGLIVWFRTYVTFRASPIFFVEDIFVRPQFRKRGIGRAFFRHLAQMACAENAARIDWAVLDWNSDAIAFYESIGAPIAKEWRICNLQGAALERLAR
jgi:GNAT superfamily N-acetyltransferase